MVVTLSNLNRFSKFFYRWKENEIFNKTHVSFLTTPSVCCRTTFRNLSCHIVVSLVSLHWHTNPPMTAFMNLNVNVSDVLSSPWPCDSHISLLCQKVLMFSLCLLVCLSVMWKRSTDFHYTCLGNIHPSDELELGYPTISNPSCSTSCNLPINH